MNVIQVKLKSTKREVMTTWVDARPELKLGCYITLKDIPGIKWRVEQMFGKVIKDAKDFDFHRKWDNNNYDKHKGLNV